jgi:hypothetical protein
VSCVPPADLSSPRSHYIAEFFSTLSSVPIALYGLYYLQQTARFQHGWKLALSSLGVTCIGLGSIAFHGTMQRWGQMLDELPMLWTVVFFLFTTLTIDEAPGSRRSTALGLALACYALVNSAVYFAGGFVWFIMAYIAAVVAVFGSTAHHMLREENRKHETMRSFGYRAMGFYAAGFVLFWVPEQVLCGNQVRRWLLRGRRMWCGLASSLGVWAARVTSQTTCPTAIAL